MNTNTAETTQKNKIMSFMIFKVQCKKCKYIFDTAFGIVNTHLIAQPAKKCPKCHSDDIKNLTFPKNNLKVKKTR